METEFKYNLEDTSIFDSIVETAGARNLRLEDVEVIDMHAAYFDTEDFDFRKRGIAYRIRQEDDRCTATIKWDVNVKEGLHRREEFNLVVNDERFALNPNIDIFVSSDAYDVLLEAAGDKPLKPTISMDYQRRQFKVDTGRSISCISLDEGVIHHIDGHTVPISELEIEWYYGAEEDFMDLAYRIQSKYGLVSEDRSKLQRAFE
ncbi:MAG: CYTH domain-containing protein [Mogibacterium sp.]|jgi:triphosphatase|nr:CYTH domain-containing protein [Mogibacterium sp.]MBR3376910.1 CYTH domain-containing protein [Mogibacterium sp.]